MDTNLNMKHKTVKLLHGSIGENLSDQGFSEDFLDTTPKAPSMKQRTDKLDFFK